MINILVKEIESSLNNKLFFVALNAALTLPDICGKAEYPNTSVGKRYRDWINTFLSNNLYSEQQRNDSYPFLNGDIIYQLRCSLSHQGTPNIDKKETDIDRFVLTIENDDDSWLFHSELSSYSKKDRSYQISIRYLCYVICKYALAYYNSNKNKFNFINYTIKDYRGT